MISYYVIFTARFIGHSGFLTREPSGLSQTISAVGKYLFIVASDLINLIIYFFLSPSKNFVGARAAR